MQFWPKLGREEEEEEREGEKQVGRTCQSREAEEEKNTKHNWKLGKLSTKKPHYQMEMWHKRS